MRKFLFVMLCLFSISLNSVAATPSSFPTNSNNEQDTLPNGMPTTISLLDETPLYPAPDDTVEPWAALSPQDIEVIQTQYQDNSYASPSTSTWLQVQTSWLGNMWIKLQNEKLGYIRPFNTELILNEITPLYEKPYHGAFNGAGLSPQTVTAVAEFISPAGYYALEIETSWLGKQ